MNISEVNNITSYQGQGSSSVNVAPKVSAPEPAEKISEAKSNTDIAEKDALISEPGREEEKAGASMGALKEAVSKINAATQSCEAVFGIHEATNRVTIKMVDKETKEVVKEFPAEETLDLIAKAWDLAGIMVDEKR